MDIAALINKYDQPVPRYTSYPTAVHFNDSVSQETHRDFLTQLRPDNPVSLYIHIPFCKVLCHYCGCHTQAINRYDPVSDYLTLLHKEIALVGRHINSRIPVKHVHFGGGSPNVLKYDDLRALLDAINTVFDISETTDIAMEADPRLLTRDIVSDYLKAGLNRISLGVQDLNKDVQMAVNRVQNFNKIQESVMAFREGGVRSLNFDMMYGLPLQTPEHIERNVEAVTLLAPDRLAVFGYAHVPWMKKHQKLLERFEHPDAHQRYDMRQCYEEGLTAAGYRAIGIDHFAKPEDSLYQALKAGKLHRNFQGYTDETADTIIGLGISSISSYAHSDIEGYIQNMSEASLYRSALQAEELPVKRGKILNDDDIRRRAIIEKLMCYFKADISEFPDVRMRLVDLEHDGLVTTDGDDLYITHKGKAFARLIAACFDGYYQPEEGRHAKAI